MQATVWRNIPMFRNRFSSSPHFSLFHSTPISFAKWKSKWKNQDEGRGRQPSEDGERVRQPSKTYIRYAVRQKRADTKRALKDLLFNGKTSKLYFQDEIAWCADETSSRNAKEDGSHDSDNLPRLKNSRKSKPPNSSNSRNSKHSGSNRRQKKHSFYCEDDAVDTETIFQATFGGNRCFTWSFRSWESCNFQNPTAGFEWRDESKWGKARKRVWEPNESDLDDDDESSNHIGSYSHRVTLGLPTKSPLKIDDVKCAFRTCALKWHPDKHQGPSQAMAEEKFKLCVDAYNSLCNALASK